MFVRPSEGNKGFSFEKVAETGRWRQNAEFLANDGWYVAKSWIICQLWRGVPPLSMFGWSDLLQILRKQAAFSFAVLCIIMYPLRLISGGSVFADKCSSTCDVMYTCYLIKERYLITWNFCEALISRFWGSHISRHLISAILRKFAFWLTLMSRFWLRHTVFLCQCYLTCPWIWSNLINNVQINGQFKDCTKEVLPGVETENSSDKVDQNITTE